MRETSFILFTLFIGISYPSFSQHESIVAEINLNIEWIDSNIEDFEINRLNPPGKSTEGGELIKYFHEKHAVKIIENYFAETGKTKNEYYLKNDSLIFIVKKTFHYNMPIYIDSLRAKELEFDDYFKPYLTDTIEDQLFFKNKKLIKLVNSVKGNIEDKNPQFIKAAEESYSWFQKVTKAE